MLTPQTIIKFSIKNEVLNLVLGYYDIREFLTGSNLKTMSGCRWINEGFIRGPEGGSISKWFAEILEKYYKDFVEFSAERYIYSNLPSKPSFESRISELVDCLRKNSDIIDSFTKSSEIEVAFVQGEGDAYYELDLRGKGKIKLGKLTEDDYANAGARSPLWHDIQYGIPEEIKNLCKKKHVYTEDDPWAADQPVNAIYDSFSGFQNKEVFITGEFKYGSKNQVKEYIQSHGGKVISHFGCYMLIGSLGSTSWSQNDFGTKMAEAVARKITGSDITIVKEEDAISQP